MTVFSLLQQLIPIPTNPIQQANYPIGFIIGLTSGISFLIRVLISLLISIVIIKFYLSSMNNLIITNDCLLSLSRFTSPKVFGLTASISGISNAILATLPLLEASQLFNVNTVLNTITHLFTGNVTLMLSPWLFPIEFIRLSILIWLIKRHIIQNSKIIWQKEKLADDNQQGLKSL